jgi:serine phosphatase RsbU (regulator of sigma subunit)
MDRRSVDRWLSLLILPASAALVLSALTLSLHAYTGVSVTGDRVGAVTPGSPGDVAGLRPGDRIRDAEGRAHPSAMDPNPLHYAQPGTPVLLDRERSGTHRLVWLVPEALPESERRFQAFLFAVASGFLLLGGWVWSERRDRLTRAFLVLCVAFAGMLTPDPRFGSRAWQLAYDLGYTAAQLYAAVVFAHFFALFPEPAGRTRHRAWVRAGYVLASLLWLGALAIVLEDVFGPGRWGPAIQYLSAGALALFAGGMLGGLALFAGSFSRTRTPDGRRRLRVAFFGTLLGAAPFVFAVAWRNLVPGTPLPAERLTVAFTLFVPASFAWAIAVHRVFDFRVALRAMTVLLLAGLGAAGLYGVGEWLANSMWPQLGEGVSGASLALLALVAALAGPVRPLLSGLGARVVPIADEVSLGSWTPSADAVRSGQAAAILREACEAVVSALRLEGCAAARGTNGELRLVASAGARLMPALGPSFADALDRMDGPGDVSTLQLSHEDRDMLEMARVHWVLPVPGTLPLTALFLGRRLAGPWLDRGETRDLEWLGQHLAVALENVELKRDAGRREALDRELREAHTVQLHRLPRRTPVYPTLDCAAVTLSTESVGGDYYDFIQLGLREFTLAVGDAAGHGVPAALVLAGVQSRFRAEAARARHPGELLEALNRDLVAVDQPEKFVGLLCARVDVAGATLRIANAGLTPPLVRRADGRLEELRDSGLLLGVSESARYGTAAVELGAGDVAVVYTDGITEATRGDRMFGVEGIAEVLDRHAHRRAADIVEELTLAVRRFADQPLDDITVVVLRQLTRPGRRDRNGQRPIKSGPERADNPG